MKSHNKWLSEVPPKDDFGRKIIDTFIDGKTVQGPWALMTVDSYFRNGVGLGLGKGQLYKKAGKEWIQQSVNLVIKPIDEND